ncbi:hypothetical protein HK100_012184, partial [Physocladia obscura]
WREITRSLINGYESLCKYQLSELYKAWCEKKLVTHPDIFTEFLHQKGIIHARNLFLKENEIEKNWSNLLEEASKKFISSPEPTLLPSTTTRKIEFPKKLPPPNTSLAGYQKIIILPIAIVGLGKTTLGSGLKFLFHNALAEVQSDNYKKKQQFLKAVVASLEKKDVVYADRNNHLDMHRLEVASQVRQVYPGARILAVEWDVKNKNVPNTAASQKSIEGILARGERHQTLTPKKKPDFQSIVDRFFKEFTPADDSEGSFDTKSLDARVIIPLDSLISDRVKIVCDAVGWKFDEQLFAKKVFK